jgi:hypothetical protein
MASPIPCLSQFNLLLVLLVVMTPKFPFTKSKKRKTKEQLRREHSSTGADPERIPRLSLYPTSFDLTRKNPAAILHLNLRLNIKKISGHHPLAQSPVP